MPTSKGKISRVHSWDDGIYLPAFALSWAPRELGVNRLFDLRIGELVVLKVTAAPFFTNPDTWDWRLELLTSNFSGTQTNHPKTRDSNPQTTNPSRQPRGI